MLLDSILQMQLFQINQSEDSSKITIMSDTTPAASYIQRPITSASNYNCITLIKVFSDYCVNQFSFNVRIEEPYLNSERVVEGVPASAHK